MKCVKPTATLRKQRGLTQQALAVSIEGHVNQIKRYAAATAQPTVATLVTLAQEPPPPWMILVFGEEQRGPTDGGRHLQLEARGRFDDGPKKIAKALLENLTRKGDAKRAFAAGLRPARTLK